MKPWAPTHITGLVDEREQLDTGVKEKVQQGVVFPPAAPGLLLKISVRFSLDSLVSQSPLSHMLRRQSGSPQESGTELTAKHTLLGHLGRNSIKSQCDRSSPSLTIAWNSLGASLDRSVILHTPQLLSSAKTLACQMRGREGRFQSLVRAEALTSRYRIRPKTSSPKTYTRPHSQ